MGKEIIEALRIMQHIGITYLEKNGKAEELLKKHIIPD